MQEAKAKQYKSLLLGFCKSSLEPKIIAQVGCDGIEATGVGGL